MHIISRSLNLLSNILNAIAIHTVSLIHIFYDGHIYIFLLFFFKTKSLLKSLKFLYCLIISELFRDVVHPTSKTLKVQSHNF